MGNNYFQFKQFRIVQEKSAMKVGTDGILLGAWANISEVKSILDVGTGTGLIAIMLAQRCDANITGIEIEKNAAKEALININKTPWKDRFAIQNISLQDFGLASKDKFDLIVSNPPFFEKSLKTADKNRKLARHNDSLSFTDLIINTKSLLTQKGHLAVILPFKPAQDFIEIAESEGLNLVRMTMIKPKVAKNANRCLMEFSRIKVDLAKNYLIVYDEIGGYSKEFKLLTKDFYLKF